MTTMARFDTWMAVTMMLTRTASSWDDENRGGSGNILFNGLFNNLLQAAIASLLLEIRALLERLPILAIEIRKQFLYEELCK